MKPVFFCRVQKMKSKACITERRKKKSGQAKNKEREEGKKRGTDRKATGSNQKGKKVRK